VTYPQQGGYGPPQGGYGPQQGGYPPPGYPPPGYPPPGPGGYGQYPPPKKNNTGLIVGIASAVVVVVVAVVLVIVLTGDDDKDTAGKDTAGGNGESVEVPGPNMPKPGGSGDSGSGSDSGSGGSGETPQSLADAVVDIIETQDADAIDPLACTSGDADELKSELSKLEGMDVSATVEDVQESGDTAQASIQMQAGGQSEGFTIEMAKQNDSWCASGI